MARTRQETYEMYGEDIAALAMSLKDLRLGRRMTQRALAARMCCNQARVSEVERGSHDMRLSTLTRFVEGLGLRLKINVVDPAQQKEEMHMARLPGEEWLIQQIDGVVVLFHEHTGQEIVRFDPGNADAAAQAQEMIAHAPQLDEEQRCFAHFWSGYFYAHARGL